MPLRASDTADVDDRIASEISSSAISHAPVHIKIEEKLLATVSRDGGLESGEVYHQLLNRRIFRRHDFMPVLRP